ncbi:hypothetical protein M0802_013915 [Mischocyttarus mexicanus]|nr:hypothetical protein M0802_013915 [Mischocyttarus mexicanus]
MEAEIKELQKQMSQKSRNPPESTAEAKQEPNPAPTPSLRPPPSELSKYLVQDLIECFKQRLTGSAYQLFVDVKFQSLGEFFCAVKRTFAANKTLTYYFGDLSQLKQKPNESVVRYACRTRNLESALLDASRTEHTNGGTWSEDDIKSEVLKKFINGTNYLIRAELKQSGNRDLTEAIENATIIEQNVMETDPGLLNRGKSNTPQDTRYGHKQFNVGNRDYHQNYRPNIVNRNSFRRYDRDNAYSNPRQGYVTENRQNYRPSYPNPPQEDYRDERPRNYRDNRNYEVDRNQKSHPPHYKYETDRRNAQSNNPPAGIRIALPPQTEITACKLCKTIDHLTRDCPRINAPSFVPGISHETVFTLGTVTLKIFSKNINFHVISHNVPIPGNGILGDEFFEATQADFSYRKRHLFFDDIFIPFQDYEPLTIDAKETQKVEVIISNPETKVGLLERNEPIPGVYYEKVVVTPIQGRVIIDIVNDTDTAIIMKIPTLTILPLKEEVISVVEELESGGATSVVDNHTNETMMGENFSENVGIEAPVITSPSGQATSDVDDRVKENIMEEKKFKNLIALVRPYNTRAKSKQNQLPSPPTETTETEHLDETPATIPPPPKYTYLPSPSARDFYSPHLHHHHHPHHHLQDANYLLHLHLQYHCPVPPPHVPLLPAPMIPMSLTHVLYPVPHTQVHF